MAPESTEKAQVELSNLLDEAFLENADYITTHVDYPFQRLDYRDGDSKIAIGRIMPQVSVELTDELGFTGHVRIEEIGRDGVWSQTYLITPDSIKKVIRFDTELGNFRTEPLEESDFEKIREWLTRMSR